MNDGLKQRLIGALVLLGIAVIFLPGFFKERSPYQVDTRTQIPAPPAVEPTVIEPPRRVADMPPSPEPEVMFLPESDQAVAENPEELLAAADEAADEPQPAPAADPEPTAENNDASEPPEDELIPGAWVVQVASLRTEDAARQLRDKLQARGYKAYVRRARTSQGEVSRVFIGPKFEKQRAEAIKREIDPIYKVDALVLQFKP